MSKDTYGSQGPSSDFSDEWGGQSQHPPASQTQMR